MKQVFYCLQMPGGREEEEGGGGRDTINCQMASPAGPIIYQMPGVWPVRRDAHG